ncbi:hypothetical protein ONS95_008191 [Cadophora gregata]|uniref:uncharacterized protein n=1 Tax=Cadophora gregata TaxID=51156 RepID=UPI0026DD9E5F|nr:uncharacterized protein ONS95_008191 [Cadophora gregata]KAK0126603.1 hypothetical protein ONS95_008191 [Cadophora gregata]
MRNQPPALPCPVPNNEPQTSSRIPHPASHLSPSHLAREKPEKHPSIVIQPNQAFESKKVGNEITVQYEDFGGRGGEGRGGDLGDGINRSTNWRRWDGRG